MFDEQQFAGQTHVDILKHEQTKRKRIWQGTGNVQSEKVEKLNVFNRDLKTNSIL